MDAPSGPVAPGTRRPETRLSDTRQDEDAWDRLGRSIDRVLPASLHLRLLWLLLVASLLLRLLSIGRPDGGLIFDERYYVNAARVILSIPPGQNTYTDRPLGLDPNTEHPPLAKLMVAGSMRLLGDGPLGWRLPSVLFGTPSILLLYGVARRRARQPATAGRRGERATPRSQPAPAARRPRQSCTVPPARRRLRPASGGRRRTSTAPGA